MNDSDPITRLNAALEGRYRIESELGEGGMATVYLADDVKHERKVALKVLKPELAAIVGAERFLTEIKTTANLPHPNILPLFDSGEADSFLYYVMPYMEGESLRERLDREHELSVSDAVRIATNVAEALDYAHAHGVIHRDIKPANILLQAGKPVISDFGIALAMSTVGGGRLTETGLSVGTPAYMSPEQATGEAYLGPATDIFALGCVLHEMLAGEPPFSGSTAQAVLGKILIGERPSTITLRASVPAHVDAVVGRALERLPADRFAQAADMARALGDPGFRHREEASARVQGQEGSWKKLTLGFAAVATVTSGLALWSMTQRSAPEALLVTRFTLPIGEERSYGDIGGRPSSDQLAISPDGETIVFAAIEEGVQRLYRRALGDEDFRPIDHTEGGQLPFFSPDGEWIGFSAGGALLRIPVGGGVVESIARAEPTGASWGDDDNIVFVGGGKVYTVPAAGGEPVVVADNPRPTAGCTPWHGPRVLPGSEAVLLHFAGSCSPADADIVALDVETGTHTAVLSDGMSPLYVETGHLLFMSRGTLMAVGFDVETLETRGQPVIMIEDVMHSVYWRNTASETGAGQVALSTSGHLVYAAGGVYPERRRAAVRITVQGDTLPLALDSLSYIQFRASPDGERIAFVRASGPWEAWIHEPARGVTQRLDVDGFQVFPIAWSPDGQSIVFTADEDVYRVAADGSGERELVVGEGPTRRLQSWSSNGDLAWLRPGAPPTAGGYQDDIWVMPEGGEEAPFFESEASEMDATFSPDGRWIAYVSDQAGDGNVYRSGGWEVYVRPYPGPEPPTQISSNEGRNPVWSPDGRRLYYIGGAGALMGVDIGPEDGFRPGRPFPIHESWSFLITPVAGYDVLSDGSIVTAINAEDQSAFEERSRAKELHVVLNWTEELKARVPR